ncbi:alpha/beta fold hydrolase [Streptomyces sp. NPDC004561]
MSPVRKLDRFTLPLTVGATRVEVSGLHRDGTGTPLLFLHGFGSTKEDYADVVQQARLAGRPVLAYDAPGCGASTCADLGAVSIPFLVSVAEQVLKARQIDRFHVVGHSMGGLTALLLADGDPGRVASFTDIEGNVAPEDCFLSRQIVTHAHDDPEEFLARFAERVGGSRIYGGALYASSLPHKVRAGAVRAIFESMVDLSDHGRLLDRFLAPPAPPRRGCSCTESGTTRSPTSPPWPKAASNSPRSSTAPTSRCTRTRRRCGPASPASSHAPTPTPDRSVAGEAAFTRRRIGPASTTTAPSAWCVGRTRAAPALGSSAIGDHVAANASDPNAQAPPLN